MKVKAEESRWSKEVGDVCTQMGRRTYINIQIETSVRECLQAWWRLSRCGNEPIGAQSNHIRWRGKIFFAWLSANMYPLITNIDRVLFNEDFRVVSGQIKFSSGLGVFSYHYANRFDCT